MDIYPSSLLVSCPGQVHQTKFANDVEGWGIAFDAKLIDENARIIFEQSFAQAALLQLTDADTNWFSTMFNLINSAVHEKQSIGFHNQLIQALTNSFFYKAAIIFQAQEKERIQAYSSRNVEILKTFHLLVKEHVIVLKKPADYASKMNITVSYLNDTVKSLTGFSSTYFIQQEVVRKAQRLLVYTTKSVKEIAFQLGYEDYKYFIRLFGKTIGTSPADFRRKNTA
ncbi:helix-turn-helix domain-containing protein [Spirosoma litoris]